MNRPKRPRDTNQLAKLIADLSTGEVQGKSTKPKAQAESGDKEALAVSNQTEENRMRINGWQRLWLLASILWAVVILLLSGILQSDGNQTVPSANVALFVVRLWIVPVAAVYGFGLGLAWVRRGFQVESK